MATIRFVLERKVDEASGATFKIPGPRVLNALIPFQLKRSFQLGPADRSGTPDRPFHLNSTGG